MTELESDKNNKTASDFYSQRADFFEQSYKNELKSIGCTFFMGGAALAGTIAMIKLREPTGAAIMGGITSWAFTTGVGELAEAHEIRDQSTEYRLRAAELSQRLEPTETS